jgi:large subunit ribosomal protein L4
VQVPVYNSGGEVVKQIDISEDIFALPLNSSVVHQALVRQQANLRQGTASSKSRSEVSGSTRKLFRQKHTGYARAGSRKSPIRRGGGLAFGPKPRSYQQMMPRKMRQLALKSALSTKAKDEELKILEQINLKIPRTKEIVQILHSLNIQSSVLIVLDKPDSNVIKSCRNLSQVKTILANLINVVDLISHNMILMTEAAVRQIELLWKDKVNSLS